MDMALEHIFKATQNKPSDPEVSLVSLMILPEMVE